MSVGEITEVTGVFEGVLGEARALFAEVSGLDGEVKAFQEKYPTMDGVPHEVLRKQRACIIRRREAATEMKALTPEVFKTGIQWAVVAHAKREPTQEEVGAEPEASDAFLNAILVIQKRPVPTNSNSTITCMGCEEEKPALGVCPLTSSDSGQCVQGTSCLCNCLIGRQFQLCKECWVTEVREEIEKNIAHLVTHPEAPLKNICDIQCPGACGTSACALRMGLSVESVVPRPAAAAVASLDDSFIPPPAAALHSSMSAPVQRPPVAPMPVVDQPHIDDLFDVSDDDFFRLETASVPAAAAAAPPPAPDSPGTPVHPCHIPWKREDYVHVARCPDGEDKYILKAEYNKKGFSLYKYCGMEDPWERMRRIKKEEAEAAERKEAEEAEAAAAAALEAEAEPGSNVVLEDGLALTVVDTKASSGGENDTTMDEVEAALAQNTARRDLATVIRDIGDLVRKIDTTNAKRGVELARAMRSVMRKTTSTGSARPARGPQASKEGVKKPTGNKRHCSFCRSSEHTLPKCVKAKAKADADAVAKYKELMKMHGESGGADQMPEGSVGV